MVDPLLCAAVAAGTVPRAAAHADGDNNTLIPNNKRLNDSVVANVYTIQHQAGCTNDVKINPQLQLAAQWHTRDVLNNRNLDGDIGSDGSTPQDRANAAGFHGRWRKLWRSISPSQSAASICSNQWYYNPADMTIMSNCANSQIGVWSENSPDRTVVVAVYGQRRQCLPNDSCSRLRRSQQQKYAIIEHREELPMDNPRHLAADHWPHPNRRPTRRRDQTTYSDGVMTLFGAPAALRDQALHEGNAQKMIPGLIESIPSVPLDVSNLIPACRGGMDQQRPKEDPTALARVGHGSRRSW